MKRTILYLFLLLGGYCCFLGNSLLDQLPPALAPIRIGLTCAAIGGIGGCVYCLRAVYINACVKKNWDPEWMPWYFLRPIISAVSGGISYLFLRAGLLILESGTSTSSTDLGFYALAFVAGYNVDKFFTKIEDVAQAIWGIEKSRTASPKSSDD